MCYMISRLQSRMAGLFVLMLLVVSAAGCASGRAAGPSAVEAEAERGERLITGITAVEAQGGATVTIRGSAPLTSYTSVKQSMPLSIVLFFPEASFAGTQTEYLTDGPLVGRVETYQQEGAARVRIVLNADTGYDVKQVGNNLEIVMGDGAVAEQAPPVEAEVASAVAERETGDADVAEIPAVPEPQVVPEEDRATLKGAENFFGVEPSAGEESLEIVVRADGPITDYKPFTIGQAGQGHARIVFDLFNVKTAAKGEQRVPVDAFDVKGVRYYGYPDRLRLVVDTVNENLTRFEATPVQDGLLIVVGGSAPSAATVQASAVARASAQKPAWVNRIDFSSGREGRSALVIGTTLPVEYKLERKDDETLHLRLLNTKIPRSRQLPLITTRFESAVNRVLPVHTREMKASSLFVIELRESVPYFVEQTDTDIRLSFERSSVGPRPEGEVALPDWKETLSQVVPAAPEPEAPAGEVAEKVAAPAEVKTPEKLMELLPGLEAEVEEAQVPEEEDKVLTGRGKKKVYTGEKIAVDFFETDIKNVLRIIRAVSGENFAIDKDVTGKVTMTLENPAPWDQILDLVLKMNLLGMVSEDGINRIATLETLRLEEEKRLAFLTAEEKAKVKVKSLEPLVTEYIVINYSDADSEIKPHLEPNLTPERGKLSVDKRTNQIIITDTAEKIAQARALVAEIDKITPQVIIEARVVEATDNFSRAIGTSWSAKTGTDGVFNSDLGGSYNYNVAMNNAVESSSSIGIGFQRLTGTSLLLDATLTAQETMKEVKIVSAPKVLTLDNKKAVIKQGVEYPYQTVEDGDVQINFKQIELKLEVTPHVTADNRVAMKILIDKNDIAGFTSGVPNLTTKNVETELLVNDGETIVIGGIIKSNVTQSEQGLPLLSKIPVLGWLFKSKTKTDDKEELLIFITPRIVKLEEVRL